MSYFYACAHSTDRDAEAEIHCIRDTEKFQTHELILKDYRRMTVMRLDKAEMDRKRPVASTAGVPWSAWNMFSALTTPSITGEEVHLRSEFPGKSIMITNFADKTTSCLIKQKGDK
jgi:hypothetical protein